MLTNLNYNSNCARAVRTCVLHLKKCAMWIQVLNRLKIALIIIVFYSRVTLRIGQPFKHIGQ